MPRRVILDIDPGVDDAFALCVALAEPAIEVVAVTATGGVVSPAQASLNVQALVERLDPPKWPRLGAADTNQLLRAEASHVHGPDGLAGADLPVAEKAHQHESVHLLCEEIRTHPDEITIISTGPMSNIATMLMREPDLVGSIGELVLLGGSIAAGGDATAAAEFNVYCNAMAAREVLAARVTKTLVPLDVSGQLAFGYELLDRVKSGDSRTSKLLASILPGYFHTQRQLFGYESARLGAVAAVLAVANPNLFSTDSMSVDVETAGELTHGVTVFDRRPTRTPQPNAEVAVDVDVERATAAVYDALQRAV